MWRAYYDDGEVHTSEDDASPRPVGVIAIAESEPQHNWMFWYGKDWYLLQRDGTWMGVDTHGLIDQILHRLDSISLILQGRCLVPYAEYRKLLDRMQQDCQPPKTGWHAGEK